MSSTTSYKWGEVVLVVFPLTDMTGTRRRPGLVLYDAGDEDVMLARIHHTGSTTSHRSALVGLESYRFDCRVSGSTFQNSNHKEVIG